MDGNFNEEECQEKRKKDWLKRMVTVEGWIYFDKVHQLLHRPESHRDQVQMLKESWQSTVQELFGKNE